MTGLILKRSAAFEGRQWVWTLAYGFHEDRTPTHGYEPTREAAMAAFAESWRREEAVYSLTRRSHRPLSGP